MRDLKKKSGIGEVDKTPVPLFNKTERRYLIIIACLFVTLIMFGTLSEVFKN